MLVSFHLLLAHQTVILQGLPATSPGFPGSVSPVKALIGDNVSILIMVQRQPDKLTRVAKSYLVTHTSAMFMAVHPPCLCWMWWLLRVHGGAPHVSSCWESNLVLCAYEASTLPAEPTSSAQVLVFKRDFNWKLPRLLGLIQIIALALFKKKKWTISFFLFICYLFIICFLLFIFLK